MKRFISSLITGESNKAVRILLAPVLFSLSFVYIIAVFFTRFLYRINLLKSVKPPVKVISVGNITWGGAGKTSLVLFLGKFFEAKGKRPAVLIRGYGSDEDVMLRRKLSGCIVLSGKDRVRNAKIAEGQYKADLLILDDGFQHWRIKRDLDIVAINATSPFGNGKIIPAGILREPVCALRRADVIVLTKANLASRERVDAAKKDIIKIFPEAEIFEAEHLPVSLEDAANSKGLDLKFIEGKRLCAVAGIGDNGSFFSILLGLGAEMSAEMSYPDHHKYTHSDAQDIIRRAKDTNSDAIITTQKDWVRLKNILPDAKKQMLLLNITLKVVDEEKFRNRIYSIFDS